MWSLLNPFQLLELNIISGQDLAPVTRSMKTYAVAWVHPDRKLSTRVDANGNSNPMWNDKFVFHVDDEFLESDTSSIIIEIYAVHWFKDAHVGTVNVLVNNVVPNLPNHHQPFRKQLYIRMEFVALQVRCPSGRPQGLLNIGVAVLDSSMRSMPLHSQISSSMIGFKDLLDKPNKNPNPNKQQEKISQNNDAGQGRKPELRRTRSDSSTSIASSNSSRAVKRKVSFNVKAGSVVNHSEFSSNVGGSRPGSEVGLRARRLDDTVGGTTFRRKKEENDGPKKDMKKHGSKTLGREARPKRNMARVEVCITDSELGPSPSEVAAEVAAKERSKRAAEDVESSILGGAAWSVAAESVEGLQSKLERWQAELPAMQDMASDIATSIGPSGSKEGSEDRGRVMRRRKRGRGRQEGGEGLFSCFSNICGCECSITCRNPFKKRDGKRGRRRSWSPGSSTYV